MQSICDVQVAQGEEQLVHVAGLVDVCGYIPATQPETHICDEALMLR
jgi:hypothetical protein